MHTILGHFDIDIDFWSHFLVFVAIPLYQITKPQMCLMLTNSFGSIHHVTVTFLVSISLYTFTINCVTTGANKMPIEYMFCFIF